MNKYQEMKNFTSGHTFLLLLCIVLLCLSLTLFDDHSFRSLHSLSHSLF